MGVPITILNPLFGEPVVCTPDSFGFRDFRGFRERQSIHPLSVGRIFETFVPDFVDFSSFLRTFFQTPAACLRVLKHFLAERRDHIT